MQYLNKDLWETGNGTIYVRVEKEEKEYDIIKLTVTNLREGIEKARCHSEIIKKSAVARGSRIITGDNIALDSYYYFSGEVVKQYIKKQFPKNIIDDKRYREIGIPLYFNSETGTLIIARLCYITFAQSVETLARATYMTVSYLDEYTPYGYLQTLENKETRLLDIKNRLTILDGEVLGDYDIKTTRIKDSNRGKAWLEAIGELVEERKKDLLFYDEPWSAPTSRLLRAYFRDTITESVKYNEQEYIIKIEDVDKRLNNDAEGRNLIEEAQYDSIRSLGGGGFWDAPGLLDISTAILDCYNISHTQLYVGLYQQIQLLRKLYHYSYAEAFEHTWRRLRIAWAPYGYTGTLLMITYSATSTGINGLTITPSELKELIDSIGDEFLRFMATPGFMFDIHSFGNDSYSIRSNIGSLLSRFKPVHNTSKENFVFVYPDLLRTRADRKEAECTEGAETDCKYGRYVLDFVDNTSREHMIYERLRSMRLIIEIEEENDKTCITLSRRDSDVNYLQGAPSRKDSKIEFDGGKAYEEAIQYIANEVTRLQKEWDHDKWLDSLAS